jgi:hypothetical protein
MIERPKRNIGPHTGIVRFHIFVHRNLPDGSLDPEIIDCSDLFADHKISNRGEISVMGFDKWDCVQKVKNLLEELGE